MTLDQLEVFEKIIEKGSFKAAAEDLFKSQPAISLSLSKLEKEIGFSLFNRDAYRAALTEKGQEFYQTAREVLESQRYLEKVSRELKQGREVYLSLIVSALFPIAKLSEFLQDFTLQYASTRLEILQESLKGTMEPLLKNEAALSIGTLNDFAGIEIPLEKRELMRIKMIPVIASSFPEDMTERRLKRVSQIVLADSSREIAKSSAGLLRGGKKWRVNSHELKRQFIVDGLGWGSLPEHVISEDLKSGRLRELNDGSIKSIEAPTYLLRRSDIPHGEVAKAIWDSMDF